MKDKVRMVNGTKALEELMKSLMENEEPRKAIRKFSKKYKGLLPLADDMLGLEDGEFKEMLHDAVSISDLNHVMQCDHCVKTTRELAEAGLRHTEMLFEEVDIPLIVMHMTLVMNLIVRIKTDQSNEFLLKYLMPRIMQVVEQDEAELHAEIRKAEAELYSTERTDH